MSLKILSLLCCTAIYLVSEQPYTIMIDPAGDAKHTGREIEDTFERGITIQCAQRLKEELMQLYPNIRVILTRVPGESLQPLQNASFANRLDVQFYLSIGLYHEPKIPTHVCIFYYLEQPTDRWHTYNPLQFYHITQAHLINIKVTEHIAKKFRQTFGHAMFNNAFVLQGVFGAPIVPLLGIKAPALYIEAGLKNTADWKYLISPLIASIEKIIF